MEGEASKNSEQKLAVRILEEKLQEALNQNQELKQRLKDDENKINELSSCLDTVQEEKVALSKELEYSQTIVKTMEAKVNKLSSENEEIDKSFNEVKETLKEVEVKVNKLSSEKEEIEKYFSEAKETLKKAENEIITTKSERDELKKTLETSENNLHNLSIEKEEVDKSLNELRAKVAANEAEENANPIHEDDGYWYKRIVCIGLSFCAVTQCALSFIIPFEVAANKKMDLLWVNLVLSVIYFMFVILVALKPRLIGQVTSMGQLYELFRSDNNVLKSGLRVLAYFLVVVGRIVVLVLAMKKKPIWNIDLSCLPFLGELLCTYIEFFRAPKKAQTLT